MTTKTSSNFRTPPCEFNSGFIWIKFQLSLANWNINVFDVLITRLHDNKKKVNVLRGNYFLEFLIKSVIQGDTKGAFRTWKGRLTERNECFAAQTNAKEVVEF